MGKSNEKTNEKLTERFGKIEICNELKQQILQYTDNNTLVIANEHFAAVVTGRTEHGTGCGYWDQVRVFFDDQEGVQEWSWRHKDNQCLDKKHLAVNSISNIKASKDGDRIIVTTELVNNTGKRTVDFEFTTGDTKSLFKDGEISTSIVKTTGEYARKEMDDALPYATDLDNIQKIAKNSGIELIEDDFRKVVENILDVGLPEYVEKARKVATVGGFELTKDDYKNFVARHDRRQYLDADDGKFHMVPTKNCKMVYAIDVVVQIVNFSKEDYEDVVNLILARNKLYLKEGYAYDEKIDYATKVAIDGKLDDEVLHKIAVAYVANCWYGKALDLYENRNFKFTKNELKQLADGFLKEALTYKSSAPYYSNKAKELAKLAGFELNKGYAVSKYSQLIKDRPDVSKLVIKELEKISILEKSLPEWFDDVRKPVLEEAERMFSFKPEMRSAESQTGYKPYEKPEITESVVDEMNGRGAFVLKEQIDHDTCFPQMRYELYFIDKSGGKRIIFEDHDYVDDGRGGSIYIENDPSITEVKIADKKIKFKVGAENHEVLI